MLYSIVGLIMVLAVAVVVHEFGHFWIARRNGVRVEEFCIGFPPRIFKFKRGDTQYSIGIVPLGGFVKMAGEEPDAVEGKPDEFYSQPIAARMRIAAAGPIGNFICAYVCMVILLSVDGQKKIILPNVMGTPDDTAAYAPLGVERGDRIVQVGNAPVNTFNDVAEQIEASTGPLKLTLERGGVTVELNLDKSAQEMFLNRAVPYTPTIIHTVVAGDPAANAGFMPRDRVVRINDRPIFDWNEMYQIISTSPGETLAMAVERAGAEVMLAVAPTERRRPQSDGSMKRVGQIGVTQEMPFEKIDHTPLSAMIESGRLCLLFIPKFIDVIHKILFGEMSVQGLAGPIGIAQFAGSKLEQGFLHFLEFTAMMNMNLGFVNLIPFLLITDGGLMFLFGIEAVRRKKMSTQGMERWGRAGIAMLLALLLVVTYNDLDRLGLFEELSRFISRFK